MRNLALQGEVRHLLPARNDGASDTLTSTSTSNTNIVAVIQNASGDLHIGPNSYANHHYAGGLDDGNHDDASGAGDEILLSKQPPVSFVVTSDGYLSALDANDQLVWRLDLEKVVEDSNDEDDEEEGGGQEMDVPSCSNATSSIRSQWFYAASFLQENSPDMDNNEDEIMGMNLGDEGGLNITCLSHAGHIVSVSIDSTNTLASSGGVVEEGSECIGSFENGLECGGWSPDGEVLALVTFTSEDDDDEDEDGDEIVQSDAGNVDPNVKVPILMTMNTQYEILSEVHLDPCLFAVHSSAEDEVDGSLLHPNAISLCWRPDSSSLAVSTMDDNVNNKPLRRVRTYHRTTLQILSLSKEEDGSGRDVPNLLPVAPTWAPAGCSHYVGVVQSSRPLNTKSARARQISMQVAFMEPNGLRHRECKIHNTVAAKTDKEDITSVGFNLEGDLLAVSSRVTSKECQFGKVQLYHRSNYHWYLKYEMRYDGNNGTSPAVVSTIKFSEEDPYKILVALSSGTSGLAAASLEWREYTFRWESSTIYYRNQQSPMASSVLAMSIDGKKLNTTPLDKAVIPPPMYASSLELPAPVIGIATRPSFFDEVPKEGIVDFVISMSDGRFALLQSSGGGKDGVSMTPGFQPPSLVAIADPFKKSNASDETVNNGLTFQGMALRDVTIIDVGDNSVTVAAVSCPETTPGKHHFIDHLIEMKISWAESTETADVMMTSSLPLEDRALRIVNWSDTAYAAGARGGALLELADGTLLEYSQGGVLEPCDAGPLLEACPWISGIYDASSSDAASSSLIANETDLQLHDESSKRLVIGLSTRYRLYCGERLLSSASSSFDISLQHRFITHVTIGSRPQARFLPLASLRDFDPLMGSDENMALDGYEPRSVERGSRLVAIFPTKPTLIIQMPRGNLELISPRALVLPYIMMMIQARDFRTALDLMRRQRVDMNLIVDLDPAEFLEKGGVEQFIGQIEKIDYINLFLSSLIDVDTTLWKYPVPTWIKTSNSSRLVIPQNAITLEEKVNKVCKNVRGVLLDAEKEGLTSSGKIVKEGHFLLPILSTFAKESPPKLEEALNLIKSTATRDPSKHSKRKSVLLSEHVQSSIQYLAFLANYEHIFNTAIGMYDFELAKAVARHSQMDPKVYLPMLKRWRELPEATARYEVDVKLKRYESALRHLVAAGQVEEGIASGDHVIKCLKFIDDHSLHKLGLELFKADKNNYRSVMVSLGEHLFSERKSEEALTVFLAANPRCLDGGKRAARNCGDWRTYFACFAEGGEEIDSEHISAMAESISTKFGSMREQQENYASAASILLDYAEDVGDAIDMLISGHLWSEGRRIAHLHKRPDLAKKVVDGAVSYTRTCVEDLAERASTFGKTNERYGEVIVIRRDAIREAEEAGIDLYHDDSASMFSMQSTASNTSLRSMMSAGSNASRASVGSVGTVASVSTVISVGAKSTFSFTGEVDSMKHKSKFNKIGRNKKKNKKPKKKGSAAKRSKPGSEEELKELLATLKHTCPDEHHVNVISETVTFLLQSDKQSMATLLFQSYNELVSLVEESQTARLEQDKMAREEHEQKERKEGRLNDFVEHPCEKEITGIRCKALKEGVHRTFSYF